MMGNNDYHAHPALNDIILIVYIGPSLLPQKIQATSNATRKRTRKGFITEQQVYLKHRHVQANNPRLAKVPIECNNAEH